jgi:hypothetical protein
LEHRKGGREQFGKSRNNEMTVDRKERPVADIVYKIWDKIALWKSVGAKVLHHLIAPPSFIFSIVLTTC